METFKIGRLIVLAGAGNASRSASMVAARMATGVMGRLPVLCVKVARKASAQSADEGQTHLQYGSRACSHQNFTIA